MFRNAFVLLLFAGVVEARADDEPVVTSLQVGRETETLGKDQEAQSVRPRNSDVGTLTGRFVYEGAPPPVVDLFPELSKIDAATPHIGPERSGEGLYRLFLDHGIRPRTEDQSLLVDRDKGVANVVIWVVSLDIPWTAPADLGQQTRTITFKEGRFAPRVAVAVAQQPIVVQNQDPVGAHVRVEPSRPRNKAVNQLLKPNSTDAPFEFAWSEAETVPAKVGSNLAPWATGWIFVRANPFVAISQSDGSFTIPDMPPGEWEFQVWHERQGSIKQWPQGRFKRTVTAGENDLGEIRIKPQHLNRR